MTIRILAILPSFPFPPITGQKHRYAHLTRFLARRHEVVLACFSEPADKVRFRSETVGDFSDLRLVELPTNMPRKTSRSWLSSEPSEARLFRSHEMMRTVQELVDRLDPHVILSGDPMLTPYVAPYADRVRVLDYVCEVVLQLERLQALTRGPGKVMWAMRRAKQARYLKRLDAAYDLTLLNSEEDLVSLRRIWPEGALMHIPNGLDFNEYPKKLAQPKRNRLIYPGSVTYPPNRDAIAFFGAEVLPRLRREIPEVELLVTGPVPEDGSAPQFDGVTYTGYVDDIRMTIAEAWACVVPLRLGAGGARFKVLEALALGTPIIATAIGYEGLVVTPGTDMLHAESADEFVSQCLAVLTSETFRGALSSAGRAFVERQYNWNVLGPKVEEAILQLLDERSANTA